MVKRIFSKKNNKPSTRKDTIDINGISQGAAEKISREMMPIIFSAAILTELINLGLIPDDVIDIIVDKTLETKEMFYKDTIDIIKKVHLEKTPFNDKTAREFITKEWKKASKKHAIDQRIIRALTE